MKKHDILKSILFPKDGFSKSLRKYALSRPVFAHSSFCHAPMRNMYIGHGGVVTACCFNRTHALGVWPVKSLLEIWKGARADELRKALENYDLSKGCAHCEVQLLGKNFEALKARQFDSQKQGRHSMPTVIEFELDNKCNFACTMCNENFSSVIAAQKGLATYKSPYNESFLDDLRPFIPYLSEAKFYGGEPFLIKIYYEIWDMIISLNPSCRISIQTNGSIFNDRVEKLLLHSNIHLNVSLDSLKKETFERIRVGGHFETVMKNAMKFLEYSKGSNTFFGISACMMQQNVLEAPEFIRFCNELNIPVYFHSVFEPEDCTVSALPAVELEKIHQMLSAEQHFTMETAVHKKNVRHYHDFVRQVAFWKENSYSSLKERFSNVPIDMEDFYRRISLAASSVYGEKQGSEKAGRFKMNVERFLEAHGEEWRDRIVSNINHEDLSSSIHKFIDLDAQEMERQLLLSNRKL
jgi:MoaA/NifB/PqqE/SkfB family radical SAM enzyme